MRGGGAAALVGMIATVLVLIPSAASADNGPPFDLASDARALLDGPLGAIAIDPTDTDGYRGSGPCPTDADPDGYAHGAVFTVQTDPAARLAVTITDDLDGSLSLCRVALLGHQKDGASFSDPFDEQQRAMFEVAATDTCASASSCSLNLMLAAGTTYHLAVFAAPPDAGEPESRFSITGTLRRPVSIGLSVSGHRIRDRCLGYYEIISGRRIAVSVRTSPAVDGALLVRSYIARSSGWDLMSSSRVSLSAGRALIHPRVAGTAKRRFVISLVPSEQHVGTAVKQVRYRGITPRWRRYGDGGALLAVRYYRQQHRLSCEAATLRMAHNYHHPGRIDRDMDVYRSTGIERYRRPARPGGCNPDRAFCGRVNGTMMRDGYGVHAGPIARAATRYDTCRPALLLRDYSYATLARHVNNGYPVIVWGAHRGATGIYRYRWRAWDGHRVTAYSVEHTWTVIGFRGPVSSPTKFIIHDPSRGATRTVARWQLRAFTKYFETAVVVRG